MASNRAELIADQDAAYEESLQADRAAAARLVVVSAEDSAARLRSAMQTDEVIELTGDFLSVATNSFDEGRLIGEGAFGKVYEGVHQSVNQRFAVKRLTPSVGEVLGCGTDSSGKVLANISDESMLQCVHPLQCTKRRLASAVSCDSPRATQNLAGASDRRPSQVPRHYRALCR